MNRNKVLKEKFGLRIKNVLKREGKVEIDKELNKHIDNMVSLEEKVTDYYKDKVNDFTAIQLALEFGITLTNVGGIYYIEGSNDVWDKKTRKVVAGDRTFLEYTDYLTNSTALGKLNYLIKEHGYTIDEVVEKMFGVELYKEKWNELLDYVKVLEQGNKVEKKIEKEVELISYWNKEVEEKIETKIVELDDKIESDSKLKPKNIVNSATNYTLDDYNIQNEVTRFFAHQEYDYRKSVNVSVYNDLNKFPFLKEQAKNYLCGFRELNESLVDFLIDNKYITVCQNTKNDEVDEYGIVTTNGKVQKNIYFEIREKVYNKQGKGYVRLLGGEAKGMSYTNSYKQSVNYLDAKFNISLQFDVNNKMSLARDEDVKDIMFFESTVDLLSYVTLCIDTNSQKHLNGKLLVAVAGLKKNVFKYYYNKYKDLNGNVRVHLLLDNDEAGLKVKDKLIKDNPNMDIKVKLPKNGKDWNEYLQTINALKYIK